VAVLAPLLSSAPLRSRRCALFLGAAGLLLGCFAPSIPRASGSADPAEIETASSSEQPPGIPKPEQPRWRLTWRDEFDGPALDLTKWSYRQVGPRESSVIAADCISMSGDGLVHLTVKERDGVLQNAMIGTQKKFETRYGIMAARIRFPRQEGQHGAFWMQPATRELVPNDAGRSGSEIDIIEWFGAGRKDGGTGSNVYWPSEGPKPNRAGKMVNLHHLLPPGETWSDDFHIYSVEWSPQGYIFRVDDHEMQRIDVGISHQPQYLILSLLTADWEVSRLDRSNLPNSMDVDWVRVWQTEEAKPGGSQR
jgi:beta-glucanase (GH16 family)